MNNIPKTTEQLFDDEFYNLFENCDDTIDTYTNTILKINTGDLLVYNFSENKIDILSNLLINKEVDKRSLGIIIKHNDDETIDVMMKNYLTSNSIIIPINYNNSPKNMYAYIYQLFERYCNKFKRISEININIFKYYIPSIAQLDYIYQNLNILLYTLEKIQGENRKNDFINRLYNHGVICQYKGKYYQWLPIKNEKRKINNLEILKPYEFLPMFTVQYNFK